MSHFTPKGTSFYDQASQREMMLCTDKFSGWYMWLLYKHPDGQWVSLRKATQQDIDIISEAVIAIHHLD